jgi:uncharacterized membrane protein
MKDCRSILCALGFVLLSVVGAAPADTPISFRFSRENVPGALQTFPGGINNAGLSVGQYQDKRKVLHGYILNGKKATTLDDPNGTGTGANDLNPNGAISIVGFYLNSAGSSVGFLYRDGKYRDIPGPRGATASFAAAINDEGNIVGDYVDSRKKTHGFLLRGAKYTTLDPPGSTFSVATGINQVGGITLSWVDSHGVLHSSLYNGRAYKSIDVPGAAGSVALGLDAAGDVTYEWLDRKGLAHAALLHGGKFYKFGYPKAVQSYASGINDKNEIVGGFQGVSKGPSQGFNATYK